jgi:hypothetical protein
MTMNKNELPMPSLRGPFPWPKQSACTGNTSLRESNPIPELADCRAHRQAAGKSHPFVTEKQKR